MLLIRLLLLFYPSGFRAEYGEEIRALYAERRSCVSGLLAVLGLWIEAVADVFRVAVPLHVDVLRQDARFALRSLRRSPGFALTVMGVSALGVGANTAVFSVLDVVLVRPLPYPEPDALVHVWEHPPEYSRMEPSPATWRDWRERAASFESMAASVNESANLVGSGEPVRLEGAAVTADLLPMLGARPLIGRLFAESDDRAGAPATVILSESMWRTRFGADPGLLGTVVRLDGEPHEVIGVLPDAFDYPDRSTAYWRTVRFGPSSFEDRDNNYLHVIARLNPGVSLDAARSEMSRIMRGLEAEYPESYERTDATVNRIRDEVSSRAELLLIALSGAALAVLLIACTNVASLLLARSLARSRELAVRSSLGAGRNRLARQLLTESFGLALAGGVVGILAAGAALPLFGRLVPESVPAAGGLSLDARVLVFGLLVTLLTGIAFGALPALRVSRAAAMTELRDGGRSGARHHGLRNALVMVEIAASVALLVTSGLLVRALVQLQATDPGFRAEGVLTLRTWLPWPEYEPTERRAAFYDRVLEEVRALPGVSSAAYASFTPIAMGGGIWPVDVPGDADPDAPARTASLRFITPDWFRTLDIPLLRGRDVRRNDSREDPFVAVVSESFAERYWPGRDPLGQTFRFAFFDRTVVGVVSDIRTRGLEGPSEPQVYVPYRQVPDGGVPWYAPKDLAVRSAGDPLALVPAIRDIVHRVDPGQPVSDVRLLQDIVSGDTAPRRVQLRLLGLFTAIAILLAAIGLHGLLSYTAARRSHEIGVRLALGARRRSILALVARQAALPVFAGILFGGLAGYGAGQGLRALLAGVPPADLPTFAAALGLAFVVAVAGSLQPAVRAALTDPARVIRDEM